MAAADAAAAVATEAAHRDGGHDCSSSGGSDRCRGGGSDMSRGGGNDSGCDDSSDSSRCGSSANETTVVARAAGAVVATA